MGPRLLFAMSVTALALGAYVEPHRVNLRFAGGLFRLLFGPPLVVSVSPDDVKRAIQIAISLVILSVSGFVVLARRDGRSEKRWTYASIAILIGFWLAKLAALIGE